MCEDLMFYVPEGIILSGDCQLQYFNLLLQLLKMFLVF
ncbi:hypothetical protein AC99_1960 [Escherichia coli 2-222-05_S4_C2]|nr:hypothetical protein AC99_1960 [Escherichia coli 2-222-05_S4_C2]KEO19708.1 hypothetical protein AD29_0521 [Escherichia coli 2-222-05_S4_C3]